MARNLKKDSKEAKLEVGDLEKAIKGLEAPLTQISQIFSGINPVISLFEISKYNPSVPPKNVIIPSLISPPIWLFDILKYSPSK